jgi:hypothetical protein
MRTIIYECLTSHPPVTCLLANSDQTPTPSRHFWPMPGCKNDSGRNGPQFFGRRRRLREQRFHRIPLDHLARLMLGHADAISLVPAKSEIEAKVNRMLLGLETWALKRSPHCCSWRVARSHRREIEKPKFLIRFLPYRCLNCKHRFWRITKAQKKNIDAKPVCLPLPLPGVRQ